MSNANSLVNVWPELVSSELSDKSVKLKFFVSKDLDYFNGHFPVSPLLAGVVQLHWAVSFSHEYFSLAELDVKNIEVLKFRVLIKPEQFLHLELNLKNNNKVIFSYSSDDGEHASGRIVFEEKQ